MQEMEIKLIDLDQIAPAKINYRRAMKPEGMKELTASVKSKGVLQPVLVRPANNGKAYEMVAGSRRYKAAIDAELKAIPAMIKTLNDVEVLEIQVIENDQREDPNPIDQANGYNALMKKGKYTVESLALKVNKSETFVRERLVLCKLSEKVQKQVAEGLVPLKQALMLTRLRDTKEQEALAKEIGRDGLSVSRVRSMLENHSTNLSEARFNVSLAGCEACDHLSNNQALIFPELKKTDECMDKNCFNEKTKQHFKAFLVKKVKEGFKVLTDEKAVEKLSPEYNASGQAVRITDKAKDADYSLKHPKNYAKQCTECKEHHIYFAFEKKDYSGVTTKAGEICTNRKCLDDMNGVKNERGRGSMTEPSGPNPYTIEAHAKACRDKFLIAELPGKIDASEALKKRFLIYSLLQMYDRNDLRHAEILKQFCPKYKYQYRRGGDLYIETAGTIPAVDLDRALNEIILWAVEVTDPTALLEMTPEAGIVMDKDFGADEAFLKTKTIKDLQAYAKKNKLKIDDKKAEKKGDLVKEILKHDLRGLFTPELAKVSKVKGVKPGAALA